jgi:type II secretory pathway pseudopilin PulG
MEKETHPSSSPSPLFSLSGRKGQTIVEAMVAISILLIGLMGVLTLLSRSLLLARTTADQAKATYLASEGIEVAKSLIDHGVYLGIPDPGAAGAGWEKCFLSGQSYDLDSATTGCPPVPNFTNKPLYFSPLTHLFYSADDTSIPFDATATNFVREIIITNVSVNEVDVQSTVTWSTGIVTGQSITLEDHFYNWHP